MIYSIPTVSVVIPMYNVEHYIERCLNSVLSQTWQDFEVICVDDGGPDASADIVKRCQDPRVRLVSQKNRGLAGARNTGINAARGRYVALLDADDYWAPEKLEKHIAHLESNPEVGISYCPSLFVDEAGNELGIGQFPKLSNIDAKHVFCRNPIGNGSAPVMRRQLLWQIATEVAEGQTMRRVFFNEGLRQSEDIELWLRVALTTNWVFAGIPEPLTYYTVNASGLSANLVKQFKSWQLAVTLNRASDRAFFQRWEKLAQAYQYRYLARRAVQSGRAISAITMMAKAVGSDIRILSEEPKRTLLTLGCSLLSVLPSSMYSYLESFAMQKAKQHRLVL